MFDAGRLRYRFSFFSREDLTAGSPGSDGAGNVEGDWVERFSLAAGLKFLKGGEDVIAQRLSGVQPVVITIRMSNQARQIDTNWKARNFRTGSDYNIRAITPAETNDYIDLLCEGGVAV